MPRGRPRYESPLTPREWQVLCLIEEGLTNEEIAARLGISFAGARYHVAEIISKLGVANRREAVTWAQEQTEEAAGKRRWSLPVLTFPALRLGSPFGIAGVAAGVALVAVVIAVLMLLNGDGGVNDDEVVPLEAAVDGRSAVEFFRSATPMGPLVPGQVLYTRAAVYERHGPKSPQITAANGIPVENYVRESWMEAGPNDTLVRAYTRITDPSGTPILAAVTKDGTSRIIDVQSGGLFREDEVPEEMVVIGDRAERIQRYIDALQSGEIVPVGQTASELIAESVLDQAYYERTLVRSREERRELSEEQKQSMRDCFYQRCMTEASSFAVPYYGDLNAVSASIRLVFDSTGAQTDQELTIETETGDRIVVQSWTTETAIVDAIPPEVIALTEMR